MREEREISIRITTERTGFEIPPLAGALGSFLGDELPFPEEAPVEEETPDAEPSGEDTPAGDKDPLPETSEFFAIGKLVETDDRMEIVYEESVLTGMEGSLTTIGFAKTEPEVVSMVRQGLVDTTMVFEAGRRHISIYQTPFAEFELCVCARKVSNLLLREGVIELDYITELHGARTERCKMRISIG